MYPPKDTLVQKQNKSLASTPILMNEKNSLYGKKEFYIYQDAIEKLQTHEDQLPSLPTITLEIRKATSNPNTSLTHLSSLIAKDPSLTGKKIQLVDVINLGLFHTIHRLNPRNDLLPIQELAAYKKLAPQHSMLKNNKLFIIEEKLQQIEAMTKTLA